MRLGAMQPYFFPYLGYFDLIYNTDRWIIFDVSKYIRRGWINRNRILHAHRGFQYITVPTQKHPFNTPINKILTTKDDMWKTVIMRHLYHYHKHAPYYNETAALVEECLSQETQNLSQLNIYSLKRTCEILEIPFNYSVFSEMNLELGPIHKSGDWALRLCEALNAATYINPPGGRSIYDPQEFQKHNIELIIRDFKNMTYATGPYQFEPYLSIIDVLMWNSPKDIRTYLHKIRIR